MNYVKQFNINGIDMKQVPCIELQGKPNAATEGAVGLLAIDMVSPFHEVYKCIAANGNIYTWELLSSGLSTIASTISADGAEVAQFPYDTLKIPKGYLIKVGDLIIDRKGYEYQVSAIDVSSCSAEYCGVAFSQGEQGEPGIVDYNIVYPVGSVYMSTKNVSPASFIGGTWERIKDRFLLSAGDTYTAGATGGSADAIVVEHSHQFELIRGFMPSYTSGPADVLRADYTGGGTSDISYYTESTGSSGEGANMPPYLAVYMWKRVA